MSEAVMIPAWVEGRLTPVEKIEVHRRGLRHPAVSVIVLWGSQMLIQQRAAGKYHTPSLWTNTCCTHPDWDEAPAHCARRRLFEELGLRDLPLRAAGEVEYRADVGGGLTEHEHVHLFVGEAKGPILPSPDPEEVSATRWVEIEALRAEMLDKPEQFTPWFRIYMAEHGSAFERRRAD